MLKENKNFKLIPQVMLLFALSVLVTGIITYLTQRSLSDSAIQQQTETRASEIALEAAASLQEYPAYDWLLSYWYTHADDLEIEYDAVFGPGTETEEKCRVLNERYPGAVLRYMTPQALETMQPEDQKRYAEVAYTWLITRLNQIKNTYQIDYLFFVAADTSFQTQFFLLSAADPGAVRGTSYEEVYPLGHVVTVGSEQQEAMRSAKDNNSHLADAGNYVDYYTWFGETQGHPVFIGLSYSLSDMRLSSMAQARRETRNAMLFQIILSVICLLLIYRFVLHPLGKVQKNIRLYKETKDSKTITENLRKVKAHNEIGVLSNDVSELAVEMDDYISRIESITSEKERISTELSLATKIQTAMLPHVFPAFPDRSEFEIYACMYPAREVGGDFYDFFMVDDDHLCMVIADVAGKGVPAALFMMASRILLKNTAMMGGSPSEILTKTNETICANNPEKMFVTVWIGILEISTGTLTAANAGHEYPVLQRTPERPFELMRDKHGFVIGGIPGMKYTPYTLQMTPGTKLFLYTDGVTDAEDADGEMFGSKRLVDALNAARETAPDLYPKLLLEHVRAAVNSFVRDAEQFDDLTMLCVEYKG